MEILNFDSGIKEYRLTENGALLRFNPSDPNVYARYMDSLEKIQAAEKAMAEEASKIDTENGGEAVGESIIRLMNNGDKQVKKILNDIFGHGNDFDKILDGVNLMAVASNGNRVISNLLEAFEPLMHEGIGSFITGEVEEAKKNRAQRRAMQ